MTLATEPRRAASLFSLGYIRSSSLLLSAALAGTLALATLPAQAAKPHTPSAHALHLKHLRAQQAHLAAHEAKHDAHLAAQRVALAVHNAHLAQRGRDARLRGRKAQAKMARASAGHHQRMLLLQAALHQQHVAQMEVAMQRTLTARAQTLALHSHKLALRQQALALRYRKAEIKLAALHHRASLHVAKLIGQHQALSSGNVVMAAYALRGSRYVMGGTSRSGFDCSGFVRYVLSTTDGVSVPRTAAAQYYHGKPIALTDMEPGDLVFFKNTYKHGISHVGIYAGQGKFIHAANAHKGVRIDILNSPYYMGHFAGARRVLPAQMRDAAFLR